VSDRRCPHCHNAIAIEKAFCPLCSYQIQEECHSCHELTIKWMPFCSNCGKGL
jgi:RNA polymerase subunit RPABC4/transcription elongation factor Spt4